MPANESLTPGPRDILPSRSLEAALEHLSAGLHRQGLSVVISWTGAGKTALCRAFVGRRDPSLVLVTLTKVPATSESFLRQLLIEFGVLAADAGSRAGRLELLHVLKQFLASLVPLGLRAVALVDDAHQLTPEVLEEICFVSDLSAGGRRLLHIVLVGQPPLGALLSRSDIPSLDQRTIHRHDMPPLDLDEVLDARMAAQNVERKPSGGWRLARSRRQLMLVVAVFVAAVGVVGWPGIHAVYAPRQTAPVVAQATPATGASVPAPAVAPQPVPSPEAAGTTQAARFDAAGTAQAAPSDTAGATQVPGPDADGFSVVAGSFRTPGRAAALAATLAQLDLPASVRPTATGFEQAVVGPYATRAEAVAVYTRLVAAGQKDLQIVPIASPAAPQTAGLDSGAPPSVLARATALAQKPDVNALVTLRQQIAAGPPTDSAQSGGTAALLKQVDALLDEARRRQLHLDHEAFAGSKKTQ